MSCQHEICSTSILWLQKFMVILTGTVLCLSTHGLRADDAKNTDVSDAVKKKAAKPLSLPKPDKDGWILLFDGKTMAGWEEADFFGKGKVLIKDGTLILDTGNDMTGIRGLREVPRSNYEIQLDAMRVEGSDFFCGLTFPVRKNPCSLVLGGWGGGVCGLSTINGYDASENETTTYWEFKNKVWYPVRLRVTDDRIQAWVTLQTSHDKLPVEKQLADVEVKDKEIDVRLECEPCKPYGLATWRTKGAIKNVRIRKLTDKELKTAEEKEKSED